MKVGVWGHGVTGKAVVNYFISVENIKPFVINNTCPSDLATGAEYVSEEDSKSVDFDLIILSPGVARKNTNVDYHIQKNVTVIDEIEYLYKKLDAPIIAVTGTNGKTTTVTMIKEALEFQGNKVFLGGNIGTPLCTLFLEKKSYDYIVLELSSFQLESMPTFKPEVACVLNISENHMERYDSFQDYKMAKENIFKSNPAFKITPDEIIPLEGIKGELGEHNLKNLYVAKRVLEHFKGPKVEDTLNHIGESFKGVMFRFQRLEHQYKEFKFYNDGKSTNFDATLTALNSLGKDEVILILGGKLRSPTIIENKELTSAKNVKALYFFGEAKEELEKTYGKNFSTHSYDRLEEVLEHIHENYQSGTILFSPAFPSFDQYSGYAERGKDFESNVLKIFVDKN